MNDNQYDELLVKIKEYEARLDSFKDTIDFLLKSYQKDIRSHVIALGNKLESIEQRMERMERLWKD